MRVNRPFSLLTAAALLVTPLAGQAPAERHVAIESPHGDLHGVQLDPPARGRPPVVLIVPAPGAGDASQPIAEALAREGVASLRYDVPAGSAFDLQIEVAAAWTSHLRNDARYATVSVLGDGRRLVATLAARAARADAFVSLGGSLEGAPSVEGFHPRDQVAKLSVPTMDSSSGPGEVAAFLRTVQPFGLRGSRSVQRPTTERRSPRTTKLAAIDGVRVAIEYGQPGMRGRAIWGALVPWGRTWMPGADEATTLTTSDTLAFGDLTVPPGDYTIYTQPAADAVTLIINRETGQFHTVYQRTLDLGRVRMTMAERAEPAELLTFSLEAADGGGGVFTMSWAERDYSVPIGRR